MLGKQVIIGICMMLLLIPIATAITTYEESASVSRVVGESPSDMLTQMQRNSLDINSAAYYSNDFWNNQKDDILEKQFPGKLNSRLSGWGFNDIKSSVNNLGKNELFIIESSGNPEPLYAEFGSDKVYPKEFSGLQQKFQEKNPLLVFDSPYSGIYLPKQDTFVSRTAKDSTIIAPSSFNSNQFTKSFLCQLADGKTIGEVFKDARNFHYNGGSTSSSDNYAGLVLQSYSLYGNPRQMINMQWTDAEREQIKNYCKNFLENLATDIEFLEQSGDYSKFRKHLVFEIPQYTIQRDQGFSFITSENTFQDTNEGELVLPMAIRTTHFPANTLITAYGVDAVESPEEITLNDVPSYENTYVNRVCYENAKNYEVEFENAYGEYNQDFIAKIHPVEILNCQEGKVKLYKKISYHVDYIPLSPVLIKEVASPTLAPAGSEVNVNIELMQLTNNAQAGALAIFDDHNVKVWEKEITTESGEHTATFTLPLSEGRLKYGVEFIQGNETLTYNQFSVNSVIIEPKALIPNSIRTTTSIELNFYSYSEQNFDMNVNYYLTNNLAIVDSSSFTKAIVKGDNSYTLNLPALEKKEQSYTLTLELNYLGTKKTLSYLLNTNNIPLLYIDYKPGYQEGDEIMINYNVHDIDNDAITTIIDDNRFSNLGNAFLWKTQKGNKGEYTFTITSSDGLSKVVKPVSFTIIEKQQEPTTTTTTLPPTTTSSTTSTSTTTTTIVPTTTTTHPPTTTTILPTTTTTIAQQQTTTTTSPVTTTSTSTTTTIKPTTTTSTTTSTTTTTIPKKTLASDLDNSGCVTFDDFFIFQDYFDVKDTRGDLDKDGDVDFDDFFLFSEEYGQGCNV